jgi:hypothetical protein
MGIPHKSDSSLTHSSSNDLSAHDEGVFQPVQEAPLPANQEQAILCHIMESWKRSWWYLMMHIQSLKSMCLSVSGLK